MKVKLSEIKKVLIGQYRKGNISEAGLFGLLSKILPKSSSVREKENEIKALQAKINQIDKEIIDLLKDFPQLTDKQREELEIKLGLNK